MQQILGCGSMKDRTGTYPRTVFLGDGSWANSLIGWPKRYFSIHHKIYLSKNEQTVTTFFTSNLKFPMHTSGLERILHLS